MRDDDPPDERVPEKGLELSPRADHDLQSSAHRFVGSPGEPKRLTLEREVEPAARHGLGTRHDLDGRERHLAFAAAKATGASGPPREPEAEAVLVGVQVPLTIYHFILIFEF